MINISSSQIMELRDRTGLGISDCKEALKNNGGDMEKAIDSLRAAGLKKFSRLSSKVATDGLVGYVVKNNVGTLVELNTQTDFVARNEKIKSLMLEILSSITDFTDIKQFLCHKLSNGISVEENIMTCSVSVGENVNLRRICSIKVDDGAVIPYIHNGVLTSSENGVLIGIGRIATLVGIESEAAYDQIQKIGHALALQITAESPQYLDVQFVDAEVLKKEEEIAYATAKQSGKTDDVVKKIAEGKLNKFFEEVVLLRQKYFQDTNLTMSDVIANFEKSNGVKVKVSSYARYKVGEGMSDKEMSIE